MRKKPKYVGLDEVINTGWFSSEESKDSQFLKVDYKERKIND